MKTNTTGTALITGASSGIGMELCRILARNHYALILVARNRDKMDRFSKELSQLSGASVDFIAQDLSSAGVGQDVFKAATAISKNIDILINNAGVGLFGSFADTSLARELEMIHLNITTLTELTKLFLPSMLKKGHGKILNVASTAAFQPGPLMAVYYATKAYVLSFSEAIAEELRGTGVTVTTLCPGPTDTGFKEAAKLEESKLFKTGVMSAATVAEAAYKGMMKGTRIVIPGATNWILVESVRFLPRHLVTKIVKQVQGKVS